LYTWVSFLLAFAWYFSLLLLSHLPLCVFSLFYF
jgi:hypothetical protein